MKSGSSSNSNVSKQCCASLSLQKEMRGLKANKWGMVWVMIPSMTDIASHFHGNNVEYYIKC